jgi:hypothetical protein
MTQLADVRWCNARLVVSVGLGASRDDPNGTRKDDACARRSLDAVLIWKPLTTTFRPQVDIHPAAVLHRRLTAPQARREIEHPFGGGSAMQHYRAYFLDQDGHISNAIDMECTDDEQAKECAKKFVSDRNAELWQEDRLIAIYAAGKGPLPPPGDQQC